MSIYRKYPWIIPIVPFIILFFWSGWFLISYFPNRKVRSLVIRFGSKMVSWIPKEEIMREFSHAGFKCLVHKEKSGSMHGYVILPKEHPYYGKGPDYILDLFAYEDDVRHSSTPFPGVDPWKVGIHTHERYNDIDFVVSKTKQLAEQLEERSKAFTPP